VSGSTVGATGRFKRKETEGARDWQAIEASSEFQELVKARRSFLVPATIVFLIGAIGFLLLAAFAQGFLGKDIGGIPVAFIAALSQVFLTWIITWAYLRKADRTFEPLEQRAAEAATRATEGSAR
jgi:uncharacterized membrane protein (DUF485 family)